jgi:hypothetical protein
MKARLLAAGLLVVAGANVAQAQSQQCPAGATAASQERVTQDACQKSVDLFNFMAPQLGTSIAGGNAVLGEGSTLGGLGHFSVGLRMNAIRGSVPDAQSFSVSTAGAQASNLGAKDQYLGAPALEFGLGVFKGIPVGLTNIGGVDLLASAAYLPEYQNDDIRVSLPDGSFKFGYGARVGLLSESLLVPGVSVTYLRRDLPTVNVHAAVDGADASNRDTIGVSGLAMKTQAWRVVASKKLFVFGLALGAGQDKYESEAQVNSNVAVPVAGTGFLRAQGTTGVFSQQVTRTNYFADLSFNLFVFRGTAEIGRVSGGEIETFNSFGDVKANDPRLYGSVGFKFGF